MPTVRQLIRKPRRSKKKQGKAPALGLSFNALKNNDYALASDIINKYNGSIKNISDPIVKSYIYKVQGDIAFSLNDVDNAVLFYRKASDNSININIFKNIPLNLFCL